MHFTDNDNDQSFYYYDDNANIEMNEMFDMFDTMYCNVDVCDVNEIDVMHVNDVDKDFYSILEIDGRTFKVELDTGAKCNVLSLKSLQMLNVDIEMLPSHISIRCVHGQSRKAIGCVKLPCVYKQVKHIVEFQVLPGNFNLLGRADCVQFGLLARVNKINVSNDCERIADKYTDVFSDRIGCLPGEYDIKINKEFNLVIHPPRSVPLA